MGLAASQSRLLSLTSRNSDIKLQMSIIAMQKMALAREMQSVSQEYQKGIKAKVLKWSNNNGVTCSDLTYSLLMTPTPNNANKPYIVTDINGKIVLDSKYTQYAEIICPNGNPPGDWDAVRPQILADITGSSLDELQKADRYYIEYLTYKEELTEHLFNEPPSDDPSYASWEGKRNMLETKRDEALNNYNAMFSAEVESQLQFYDALFIAVAEKGWIYNENVNDSNYLNQMFQNNLYTITTVKPGVVVNANNEYSYDNVYTTDLITNCTKVYTVSDEAAENAALVEYETTKSRINLKEQQLDIRSEKLQTEQKAISTMIESIQSVMDKNIENFNIFS